MSLFLAVTRVGVARVRSLDDVDFEILLQTGFHDIEKMKNAQRQIELPGWLESRMAKGSNFRVGRWSDGNLSHILRGVGGGGPWRLIDVQVELRGRLTRNGCIGTSEIVGVTCRHVKVARKEGVRLVACGMSFSCRYRYAGWESCEK